jgi:hypothetical protein
MQPRWMCRRCAPAGSVPHSLKPRPSGESELVTEVEYLTLDNPLRQVVYEVLREKKPAAWLTRPRDAVVR